MTSLPVKNKKGTLELKVLTKNEKNVLSIYDRGIITVSEGPKKFFDHFSAQVHQKNSDGNFSPYRKKSLIGTK